MFTDSDHSISKRGSYWQLMGWLTDFLVEKWGEGGRTKNKWKMEGRRSEGLGFESEDAP
jgi:dipeptidyl aminopeptidase